MRLARYFFCIGALVLCVCGCSSKVTILVPDMMCPESCAVKVKEILSDQPGVENVVVDFDSKTATVTLGDETNGKFDADAAIAALVDHGFDHSTLKSGGAATRPAAQTADRPAG
jgi:copper chaperone CopZ